MGWRNDQMYHLRQSSLLTRSTQEEYFKNVIENLFLKENPNQILFSYLDEDKCIGYGGLVHINWADKNAEISFVMDTKLEKKYFSKHWDCFLNLIEKVAFVELNFHKIFTYAFDVRPQLYEILENKLYIKEKSITDRDNNKIIVHTKYN